MALGAGLFGTERAEDAFLQDFVRAVDTLENVSQSIDRLADRQRIEIDSSRVLAHGQMSTSLLRIYKVPLNTVTEVREFAFTNVSPTESTVTLQVVPPQSPPASPSLPGSPGTQHIQYSQVLIRGNETVEAVRKLALEAGWELHIQSSRANAVNYHISGVELTTA